MAAIIFCGADPLKFLSKWFNKETYLLAYMFNVNPLEEGYIDQQVLKVPCYHQLLKECMAELQKKRGGGGEPLKGRIQANQNFLEQAKLWNVGFAVKKVITS